MSRLIDAETVVHWESYDDESETVLDHTGTIADFLDIMTYEGCPELVDAVPVVRCRECIHKEYCCRTISSDGRKEDDYCSYGDRKERQ